MIPIKVLDEVAPLEAVVLGTARSFGGPPSLDEAYDPKTIYHIRRGTYPLEEDLLPEMQAFAEVLIKYNVKVYRPELIDNYNQIFSRDIGMVIDDKFLVSRILKNRKEEITGIQYILDQVAPDKVVRVDSDARFEGGDIMPWNGKIFAGYSKQKDFEKYVVSRTNQAGIDFLISEFPDWEVHAFELKKSDDDPFENALHLDCCFQPLGKGKAIIYPGGFKNQDDVDFLTDFFGRDNVFYITKEEMYNMNSNVFSISPEVVVSEENFLRLNTQLREWDFVVEEIPYAETAKMEGLFRCSTLPLRRNYDA